MPRSAHGYLKCISVELPSSLPFFMLLLIACLTCWMSSFKLLDSLYFFLQISEHYQTVFVLILVEEQRFVSNDHLPAPVFYFYELIVQIQIRVESWNRDFLSHAYPSCSGECIAAQLLTEDDCPEPIGEDFSRSTNNHWYFCQLWLWSWCS